MAQSRPNLFISATGSTSAQQHAWWLYKVALLTFTLLAVATKKPLLWQPPLVIKHNLSGISVLKMHKGGGIKAAWGCLLSCHVEGGGGPMRADSDREAGSAPTGLLGDSSNLRGMPLRPFFSPSPTYNHNHLPTPTPHRSRASDC